MNLVPFLPVHLSEFLLQEAQVWLQPHLSNDAYLKTLTTHGPAFALIVDGKAIGCGGLALMTPKRAQAWALVHKDAGKHLYGATRHVREFLDSQTINRIETPVKTSFISAHRWALLLGFEREGTMRLWGDDGEDYDLYARIS